MENINGKLSNLEAFSLAVLAGGILLLIFGLNPFDLSCYGLFRFITAPAADKSTWVLVIGVVATDLGFVGLLHGSKKY